MSRRFRARTKSTAPRVHASCRKPSVRFVSPKHPHALDELDSSAQTRMDSMVARLFDLAPAALATPKLTFTPLATTSSEVDFGVDAGTLDLTGLSNDEFAELERAVLTHHVVVVRGQRGLTPREQLELTRRFDPAALAYGH